MIIVKERKNFLSVKEMVKTAVGNKWPCLSNRLKHMQSSHMSDNPLPDTSYTKKFVISLIFELKRIFAYKYLHVYRKELEVFGGEFL